MCDSNGTRPVYQIISTIKWIRNSKELSLFEGMEPGPGGEERADGRARACAREGAIATCRPAFDLVGAAPTPRCHTRSAGRRSGGDMRGRTGRLTTCWIPSTSTNLVGGESSSVCAGGSVRDLPTGRKGLSINSQSTTPSCQGERSDNT